ncbi:hypothetical protein Tco_0860740 [Tanacetum coccineum]|uniref:Reverse transcriptase Ty1/copia-type domain-containing protein n=1 Tax=Tanacetum coccineum TaxID=301880 RepID=A0ABQ5BJJ8_9ASTR
MTTIRLVLGIVAAEDLHLEQLDLKTTFLHGNLDKDMTQLEGFRSNRKEENLVVQEMYGPLLRHGRDQEAQEIVEEVGMV